MTSFLEKPGVRPRNPLFSSGPCTKRPGWKPEVLAQALVGRSHRGKEGKARLKYALDQTRSLLGLPPDYRIAIVPGSDTGAFEMAMWSLLGARGVDVLAWESFGHGWVTDVVKHLKLNNVRVVQADYGELPDLSQVDFERDVVFAWNGTTSGVRLPNADWIPHDRQGLTLVDATSAIFAQPIDWEKTDVVTYSWQKVLGGEAAHGMLILSPRAVDRLESYVPPWPLPKLFRMTKGGKLDRAIFEGETINTPSMLCVEDYLDCLRWAGTVGGLHGLTARADANASVIYEWIERTPWIANLAVDRATWSNTSVCLKIVDPDVMTLSDESQAAAAKDIAASLEREKVAYDIGSYRDAPPGLRIWTGSTVEADDLRALTPWLDWAFATTKERLSSVS
jgi:phosphoserine aminotransferase